MFAKLLGVKVEAYIDGVVLKSRKSRNHIDNVEEVFEIFRRFRTKLNPIKCSFMVSSRQFIGHVVRKIGIKPN